MSVIVKAAILDFRHHVFCLFYATSLFIFIGNSIPSIWNFPKKLIGSQNWVPNSLVAGWFHKYFPIYEETTQSAKRSDMATNTQHKIWSNNKKELDRIVTKYIRLYVNEHSEPNTNTVVTRERESDKIRGPGWQHRRPKPTLARVGSAGTNAFMHRVVVSFLD
jgi:hypothetical protein